MVGWLTEPVPSSVTIHEISTPADPPVPARICTPDGHRSRGGLVFAHGGGWATGSPETVNEHCGRLAADADVVVLSLDYRLVPEHRFPAGLDDVVHAPTWIADHADEFGIEAAKFALGGQSAGADPRDPSVSPLLAEDLAGLPPTLLLAADVDPCRDDAIRYAARLMAAGVPTRLRVFEGVVHGTESFTALLPAARRWHAECVTALRHMSVET